MSNKLSKEASKPNSRPPIQLRIFFLANSLMDITFVQSTCTLTFKIKPGTNPASKVSADVTVNGQSIVDSTTAADLVYKDLPANGEYVFTTKICTKGLGSYALVRIEVCEVDAFGAATECVAKYVKLGGLNGCKCP